MPGLDLSTPNAGPTPPPAGTLRRPSEGPPELDAYPPETVFRTRGDPLRTPRQKLTDAQMAVAVENPLAGTEDDKAGP